MNWIKKLAWKILGLDNYYFESVRIEPHVISEICSFAKENHPREFIMFLEGKVKKKELIVNGLIFQEYYANENSAMPMIKLPLNMGIVGSVHSHPGYSNRPSNADLHFFGKHGLIHLIIKKPYSVKDIACYAKNGNRIVFN